MSQTEADLRKEIAQLERRASNLEDDLLSMRVERVHELESAIDEAWNMALKIDIANDDPLVGALVKELIRRLADP